MQKKNQCQICSRLVSLYQPLGQPQRSECPGSLSPLLNKITLPHAEEEFHDAAENISKQEPQASPADIQVRHQE